MKNGERAIKGVIVNPEPNFFRECKECYGDAGEFKIMSYGLCQWTKVAFTRNDVEFYKLTRTVSSGLADELSERKEYFRGRLVRRYIGKRNCFIEFCDFIRNCDSDLSMRGKTIQAAEALKLGMRTARMYGTFYLSAF